MAKYLCVVDTDDRQFLFKRALQALGTDHADIGGYVFSPFAVKMRPKVAESLQAAVDECDFAIIYFHGGAQNLPNFPTFWKTVAEKMPCFFISSVPEELSEYLPKSGIRPEDYQEFIKLFHQTSFEGYCNLLLQFENKFFGKSYPALSFTPPPSDGIYLPEQGILTEDQAQDYIQAACNSQKIAVGFVFHKSLVHAQNTDAVDAMIDELRAQGAYPVPVFTALTNVVETQQGIKYALDRYFKQENRVIIHSMISACFFSVTYNAWNGESDGTFEHSAFEKWNVPVIKALTTHFSYENYSNKLAGIDAMSLTSGVFQPEMDGQITSVPFATCEMVDYEGIERKMWTPIPDRVQKICKAAINWGKLTHLHNQDKKVAILFHNMPGTHNIGRGTGLDTFQAVCDMVANMAQDGYDVAHIYENGQEIADALLAGLNNNTQWISPEEALHRAVDTVPTAQAKKWFCNRASSVRDNLQEFWGDAPGTVMIEDEKLLIPGLMNGKVFIGLQPSRAFDEQAERLYHDAVFPPPYSYIAYYRWIEEIFKADAIVHIGTHGSVEWLPGKEVGLSENCYPDICTGCIPHLYAYHMGITGEGIQAKRRSAAVILEHLPPSMDDAGVYAQLQDMDDVLKEYMNAKQARIGQADILAERIYELAESSQLLVDLNLSREDFDANPADSILKIHNWVEELKNSVVKDGLHLFGHVPTGDLYQNLMRMLVRVKNGNVPALNDSILTAHGYDPAQIQENKSAFYHGRLASKIYGDAVAEAVQLVRQLDACAYEASQIDALITSGNYKGNVRDLTEVLHFICAQVHPNLQKTTDELTNFMRGLRGEFITSGLGGNPTRGNVSLLPTGRNFYAGDPNEIPSRGAWEIGQKLATKSLAYYQQEREAYPESIAMVVWSGNVLKTQGEDFGEAFALMGIRPIYLGNTSKVIDIEPISLEELGHPRIDVTLRISGLFRDMYPNLMELMDRAVACVGALDESVEDNFIKKHIQEDMLTLMQEGASAESAKIDASLRIFGCPASGYGAGVSNVIGNKNWSDYHDLARVYETWSGNAYGANYHGKPMVNMFKKRMTTVGMTIKNESTVETDMLNSDDFFSYHGGLAACVRSNSGQAPISIGGHSDDPSNPTIREINQETARIMRSRILNPKWLEGLKRHGYKGAQEISKSFDSFFGWDASTGVARDWMYEEIAEKFVLDKETRNWIEQVNTGVIYHLSEKLLEANKRGMWQAKHETLQQLQRIFLNTEGLLEENYK